jgi:hypothetical protein
MRVLLSVLLACLPSFAGTIYVSAGCSGEVTTYTSDSASCGSEYTIGASAEAEEGYVTAGAWSPGNGGASASASFTEDYVFTAWLIGSGDGFAEPLMDVSASSFGGLGASASASLGGCDLGGNAINCPWDSVPFESGVPQILTLSLGADAWVNDYGVVFASAQGGGGFDLFDTNGNPVGMDGVYSFDPVPAPEPGTLPLLTGMACAAIIAVKRLRQRR